MPVAAGRLVLALLVGFGLLSYFYAPTRADFDDAAALRATTAIAPGSDIEVQVDDSEWTQTVLLVDDDEVDTIVDPTDPGFSYEPQAGYRFALQGLHNIGFGGVPIVDCPASLATAAINFWDSENCSAGPSAALLGEADLVIWFTSQAGPLDAPASTTLDATDVSNLTTYLSGGGDLFLASNGYLLDADTCLGALPYGSAVPSPGCISAANASFINTYLGVDGFDAFSRATLTANTRYLSYDPVTSDPISDAGDPLTLETRRQGGFVDRTIVNVSTTGSASGVLEDNDAEFGATLAAGDNYVATRTDDGTARVVFTTLYFENQYNRPDPNNFRTFFERSIAYLADAPSVTVSNARTGETETLDLTNSGLGVATGSIGTLEASCPCPTGDATVQVQTGDQITVSYTQSSPGVSTVTDTTTVVEPTPLSFTDAGGSALSSIPVPGSMFAQIIDADVNTSAAADSVGITITSDLGDSELVTLTETAGDSNIFRSGVIPTDLTDTIADNGTLGVADGGTVSSSYSFLGAEVAKTFTQSAWEAGTTDSTASIDASGFDERDDETAINADELGYFVVDDPGNLSTDWIKNNFPPSPNPQVTATSGIAPERFDSADAYGAAVLREPSSGDYYMWYTGIDSGFVPPRIGLATSSANSLAPIGREFVKYPSNSTHVPVIDETGAGWWWDCGSSNPTVAIDPAAPFGSPGHFIMYFAGEACFDSLSRIGRATSPDGITWTIDAEPASELVAGLPREAPFNAGGDLRPSLIYDPVGFPAAPYMLWFDDGTDIQFTSSLTGAAGTWAAPIVVLTPSATGDEWDDTSVTSPSVALDPAAGLYVMYYEGTGTPCFDPTLFIPAIGRAESAIPTAVFTKPAAPSEQAGICGEKDGGAPGAPDPPTYENIVLRSPTTFDQWEFVAADPMLLIDPADGLDRLWYNSPTESGRAIGLAWNVDADPDGTLHSNPIDLETPGYTTVDIGAFDLTHLGHVTVDLSARTSDVLDDLLFDPAPGVAYPAGAPWLTVGGLLSDFSSVTNGEKYLQYRVELAQDPAPGFAPFVAPPATLTFTDAIEEVAATVYQREDLVQALAVPADLASTDAVVRITDVTFTQDPTEQSVTYDLSSALDESTKTVVDANGDEVLPGDRLDYSIDVTNSASIPLTEVTVTDEIPLGTTYLAGSIFGTGSDDTGEPTLFWDLGTLDPGETETIGFSVIVRDDIGVGSEILNQAFINTAETGVIPTDDPRTPQMRDPTIVPVGATVAVLVAVASLIAGGLTYQRERRRRARGASKGAAASGMTAVVAVLLVASTGWLVLPVQAQSPGNDMYFEIQDADQNINPLVIDTLIGEVTTSAGDAESVTFSETDVDSGVFRATRRVVLDPDQRTQNGLLESEPGDTITLSYEDVFNTSGSTVTVSDSVTVVVSPLYTVSVIALQPRLLPGGGIEADVLASPRDVFGVPALDGTAVDFDVSTGNVSPTRTTTANGTAQTEFSSPTIVNPTVIDATVGGASGGSTGSVSLVTNTSSTTTTSTTTNTLNEPPDISLNNTGNQTGSAAGSTGPTNNTTIGNQVNNQPSTLAPRDQGDGSADDLFAFLNSPSVVRAAQITNRWIAPIIAVLTTLNLIAATALTSWYPLLLRIFLEPAQVLFGRRRRRSWGVIYNSLTKQPIDLAIVRLRDLSGRLVSTKVTDKFGRYGFLARPGEYKIEVTKAGHIYPSSYIKGETRDANFKNLYFGAALRVGTDSYINVNIPVDPAEEIRTAKSVIARHARRAAHSVVAYSGLTLGVLALVVARTWLSAVLLGLHVVVFALFWRLARGKKPKKWGVVFDQENGATLPRAVVRIFDSKFNRVLEQQVTDTAGRFGFLVGSSTYYLDAIKPGYVFPARSKTKRTDYTGGIVRTMQDQSSIVMDIPLDKQKPGQSRPPAPLNPDAPTGPIAPGTRSF